jgi:hypothetical protein
MTEMQDFRDELADWVAELTTKLKDQLEQVKKDMKLSEEAYEKLIESQKTATDEHFAELEDPINAIVNYYELLKQQNNQFEELLSEALMEKANLENAETEKNLNAALEQERIYLGTIAKLEEQREMDANEHELQLKALEEALKAARNDGDAALEEKTLELLEEKKRELEQQEEEFNKKLEEASASFIAITGEEIAKLTAEYAELQEENIRLKAELTKEKDGTELEEENLRLRLELTKEKDEVSALRLEIQNLKLLKLKESVDILEDHKAVKTDEHIRTFGSERLKGDPYFLRVYEFPRGKPKPISRYVNNPYVLGPAEAA